MSIDRATEPCGICGEQVEVNIDHCMLRLDFDFYAPVHVECCAANDDLACETHRPDGGRVVEYVDDSWMKTRRLFS